MIKLIATDMDGTLLNSKKEMHPDTLHIINKLIDKGYYFVIASGRQYFNLYNRFLNDRIIYVSENGGFVVYKGEMIYFKKMDKPILQKVYDVIKKIDNTYMIVSGSQSSYCFPVEENIMEKFKLYYSKIQIIHSLEEIDDEICKIAILNMDGTEKNVYPFVKQFDKDFNVTVSSFEWLDIMDKHLNKGEALDFLKNQFGITSDEVMIFGDYLNDLEMYGQATHTYAMQNAHPEILKLAKHIAKSNDDFGVIEVLKTLI